MEIIRYNQDIRTSLLLALICLTVPMRADEAGNERNRCCRAHELAIRYTIGVDDTITASQIINNYEQP